MSFLQKVTARIFPSAASSVSGSREEPIAGITVEEPTTATSTPAMPKPTSAMPDAMANATHYAATWECIHAIMEFLEAESTLTLTHSEFESALADKGREMLRQGTQDQFDLRACREVALPAVVDAQGIAHTTKEPNQSRPLVTRFGPIQVNRLAYRHKHTPNLYPADVVANLPKEQYSHGIREIAAKAAVQTSYESTVEAIQDHTGEQLGKRQVEQIVQRAARDVDDFYSAQTRPPLTAEQTMVLTMDGKGITMRRDGLRADTAQRAQAAHKLETRVSPGEKKNRKRMAEVGSVYAIDPVARVPSDILQITPSTLERPRTLGPKAQSKWLTASVVEDMQGVIKPVVEEAERRDPHHERPWVALLDGNLAQLRWLQAEGKARGITLNILLDFIHVLEYLWKAAWCFFPAGDPAAETWVLAQGTRVLEGKSSLVAAAMRRKATVHQLSDDQRKAVDRAARYLLANRAYLDYPTALAKGWPIATGIIEGACRHLVKDRFDITGARWGLAGAEAILKLRAVWSNGDWTAYWAYHLAQEQIRLHLSQYAEAA